MAYGFDGGTQNIAFLRAQLTQFPIFGPQWRLNCLNLTVYGGNIIILTLLTCQLTADGKKWNGKNVKKK